mmetsp:Transcript_47412/g.111742  ORF Transcript_47412/g.111742 Transcript_47412/m.111742 type:complete len:672 (-) Transcript_47412:567-2582(-)
MLRRLKRNVQTDLPKKSVYTIWCPMTKMQKFWYQRFILHSGQARSLCGKLSGVAGAEQPSSDWKKMMNLLMQLRKVCDHPYMIPDSEENPDVTDETIYTSSSKMMVLDRIISKCVSEGRKVLVYSQFTTMLDVVQDAMDLAGMSYLRLDGSTSLARRAYDIKLFNSGQAPQHVYLLSTRAGALGITLTGADTVVMLDCDWNPTWDKQAHDRVHRIGQKRPVTIYQLLCDNTVEERVFQRAQQKVSLNEMVLRDDTDAPEDESKDELSYNEVQSMLAFGAARILSENLEDDKPITLETIDALIANAELYEPFSQKSKEKLEIEAKDKQAAENFMTKELWNTKKFGGKVHTDMKTSFRSIADEWAATSLVEKRARESTTEMLHGFAVKKINRTAPVSSAPAKKVVKKAIRDTFCLYCRGGGVLAHCESSYCSRAFHPNCIPENAPVNHLTGRVSQCSQHGCMTCGSKADRKGGLLFRCWDCPACFCCDCLPDGYEAMERNHVLDIVGCVSGTTEFLRCNACVKKKPSAPAKRSFDAMQTSPMQGGGAYAKGYNNGGSSSRPKTLPIPFWAKSAMSSPMAAASSKAKTSSTSSSLSSTPGTVGKSEASPGRVQQPASSNVFSYVASTSSGAAQQAAFPHAPPASSNHQGGAAGGAAQAGVDLSADNMVIDLTSP